MRRWAWGAGTAVSTKLSNMDSFINSSHTQDPRHERPRYALASPPLSTPRSLTLPLHTTPQPHCRLHTHSRALTSHAICAPSPLLALLRGTRATELSDEPAYSLHGSHSYIRPCSACTVQDTLRRPAPHTRSPQVLSTARPAIARHERRLPSSIVA